MILAAGLGQRMGALTQNTPKALLEVGGEPLIVHQIRRLVARGFSNIVINYAAHSGSVVETVGDGERYGANIQYSAEGGQPLETGGGIVNALPLLGGAPFLVVNADVWTDYPFTAARLPPRSSAHLILVTNPAHNPNGDFGLVDGRVTTTSEPRFTYAGIGVYAPNLFSKHAAGRFPLAPILSVAADQQRVSGEYFDGLWMDVGSPAQLARIVHK